MLFYKIKNLLKRKNSKPEKRNQPQIWDSERLKQAISSNLNDNYASLEAVFSENKDIIFRSFTLGATKQTEAFIVYIEGMVDKAMLNLNIIKPLMSEVDMVNPNTAATKLNSILLNSALTVSNITETREIYRVVSGILSGYAVLLVDGLDRGIIIDISAHEKRSISEPDSEVLVRGPREGFTETMQTNIVQIRRRLKSPNLIFDLFKIGQVSQTSVSIAYLKGIASPELIEEVKQRLQRIDIDGILESGYLEEFIEDNPYSPFPQVLHTERPDRVAQCLLEGRVAIITDGTPIALVVPVDISDFLSSPEDNYQRYLIGSIIRLLRYAALLISFLLPSIYIAISSFHQEMIPTRLNISIAAYRQGVPLPILAEALLMEVVFELLREAGIRLPRSVGQAVSIVGALVIGQAAVQAGLVSPLVVIIVAFTGIASFASPNYNFGLSVRLIRFPLMLLAGSLGIFGILFGIIIISIHLAALRSFGQPYLSPLAPLSLNDVKQKIIRAPRWALDKRPEENSKFNRRRQVPDLKPGYYWHNAGDSKQGEYYD